MMDERPVGKFDGPTTKGRLTARKSEEKIYDPVTVPYSKKAAEMFLNDDTPFWKQIVTMLLFPCVGMLPMAMFMLPLNDWREGFRGNLLTYLFVSPLAMFCGCAVPISWIHSIGEGRLLRPIPTVLITLACGATSAMMHFLADSVGVFPVPFSSIINAGASFLSFLIQLYIFAVPKGGLNDIKDKKTLIMLLCISVLILCMGFSWVIYGILFTKLTGWSQTVLALLLPLMREGFKVLMSMVLRAAGNTDAAPALCFIVEYYHAYFCAGFFGVSDGISTFALVTLMDIGGTVIYLKKLYQSGRGALGKTGLSSVLPLKLSPAVQGVVSDVVGRESTVRSPSAPGRSTVVALDPLSALRRQQLKICEYLLWEEYTETFVPLQYMVYTTFIVKGWNGPSFFIDKAFNYEKAMFYSSISFAIQLTSFIITIIAVNRVYGLDMIKLCAHILRNNGARQVSTMALMCVFTTTLITKHFGNDITLDFCWLRAGGLEGCES